MLRRLSKLGFFMQFLLFLALTSLLWIPSIVHPSAPVHSKLEGPLYTLMADSLVSMPLFSTILAMVLVLILCFLLYLISTNNDMVPRENLMPAIFLLFFMSWNSNFLLLHPILPASILVLLSLATLMKSYGIQEPYNQVFISSFLVGIATLFYIPVAYLMFMIWISFVTYRITTWREWVIALAGLILPMIYLASWYYINDEFGTKMMVFDRALADPGFMISTDARNIIWLAATVLMALLAVMSVVNVIQDKLISIRKKSFIMINYILAFVLMLIVSGSTINESQQLIYIPLAFFMSASLVMLKKAVLLDIIYLIYIALLTGLIFFT
jgi:hypothetical protein